MENPTFNMVWAALEIWHGLQEGDIVKARLFIISLLGNFPNEHAVRACCEFQQACIDHPTMVFDLDYDFPGMK